jgi:hypothetical protein
MSIFEEACGLALSGCAKCADKFAYLCREYKGFDRGRTRHICRILTQYEHALHAVRCSLRYSGHVELSPVGCAPDGCHMCSCNTHRGGTALLTFQAMVCAHLVMITSTMNVTMGALHPFKDEVAALGHRRGFERAVLNPRPSSRRWHRADIVGAFRPDKVAQDILSCLSYHGKENSVPKECTCVPNDSLVTRSLYS